MRTRKVLASILAAGVVVTMIGCSAGVSVNTDYDKAFAFSALKTYTVQLGPGKSASVAGVSPLTAQRVEKAIETELKVKGYARSDADPDFVVVAHGGSQEQIAIDSWGYGGFWAGPVNAYQYTEGSLVIDMVDMASKKAIWRGVGTGIIGDEAPDEVKVNQAVGQVLASFPPGAKPAAR